MQHTMRPRTVAAAGTAFPGMLLHRGGKSYSPAATSNGRYSLWVLHGSYDAEGVLPFLHALAEELESETVRKIDVHLVSCKSLEKEQAILAGSRLPVEYHDDPAALFLRRLNLVQKEVGSTLWFMPSLILVDPAQVIVSAWKIDQLDACLRAVDLVTSPGRVKRSGAFLHLKEAIDPQVRAALTKQAIDEATTFPSGLRGGRILGKAARQQLALTVAECVLPSIQRSFGFSPRYMERRVIVVADSQAAALTKPMSDRQGPSQAYRQLSLVVALNRTQGLPISLSLPEFGETAIELEPGDVVVHASGIERVFTIPRRSVQHLWIPILHDSPERLGSNLLDEV